MESPDKSALLHRDAVLTKVAESEDQDNEVKILVLYTGGTIGMGTNPNGVYEPKPDFLIQELKKLPMFHDREYAEKYLTEEHKDYLVMPCTQQTKRIIYLVKEYHPLLDSSNMNMNDWAKIVNDIYAHYDDYDGFVVLHGTDTMAYTASALSFMCENLGKPIILTGSQIPIFEVRSDGRDNFLASLVIAGQYCIPEVLVCFDNKVLRGNRTIKNDAGSFGAFISPNLPPLATLEIKITVDWSAIYRSGGTEKFQVHTNMCHNVGILRIFPGITSQTIRSFMMPPMQGVVLQTYGGGNAPDNRPDILKIFQEATNMGVIIINITQCTRGFVDTSYATGKSLLDAGVVPGGDMTPEAALAKLSYVLSKETWTVEKKRKMMKRNLRGEMKVVVKEEISIMDFELIESVAKTLSLSSTEEVVKLRDALYPNLMCSAAKSGEIAALEKLRSTGGNLSAANQDGRTALHVASREGKLPVVQYLLHQGASVHAKDNQGHTPLMDAIYGKHLSIISLIAKTGGILSTHPVRLAMELCSCAALDDVEMIEAWRTAGADLNVGDYDSRTALHVAVSTNKINTVKYLLDNGASWELPDMFGNTALSQAQHLGFDDIVKLIEEKMNNTKNTLPVY